MSAVLLLGVLLILARILFDHRAAIVAALLMRPRDDAYSDLIPQPRRASRWRPRIKHRARLVTKRLSSSATIWRIATPGPSARPGGEAGNE